MKTLVTLLPNSCETRKQCNNTLTTTQIHYITIQYNNPNISIATSSITYYLKTTTIIDSYISLGNITV